MQCKQCIKLCFGLYLICIYVCNLLRPSHQEFLTSIPQLFWHHFSGGQVAISTPLKAWAINWQQTTQNLIPIKKRHQESPPEPADLPKAITAHLGIKQWCETSWLEGKMVMYCTNLFVYQLQWAIWTALRRVLGSQVLESLTFWKDLLQFLELKIGQIR